MKETYISREYRRVISPRGLKCYRVCIGESDLYICTKSDLSKIAYNSLKKYRSELEDYVRTHPGFVKAFRPFPSTAFAPPIVREMSEAASRFGVGPMACVAGAIADYVGRDLLDKSSEVIVENGGDIFSAGGVWRTVRIFAGAKNPIFHLIVSDTDSGIGICTSSASIGPSVSLGIAEAVTVVASTATLADAAATFLGNMVHSSVDIEMALEKSADYPEIRGVAIVAGGRIGLRGDIRLQA